MLKPYKPGQKDEADGEDPQDHLATEASNNKASNTVGLLEVCDAAAKMAEHHIRLCLFQTAKAMKHGL